MTQDILITPGSGEPQILFRGSGVNDTPIELNVLSSYQSASGSGTALVLKVKRASYLLLQTIYLVVLFLKLAI